MAVVAKVPRLLTCPGCHEHRRWSGSESGRVRCPSCGKRFVALGQPSGKCAAVPEDEGAIGQMVADWLRPDWDNEVDFAAEGTSTKTALSAIGTVVDGAAALVTPVMLVTTPDGSAETSSEDDHSVHKRTRKAG